MIVADGLCKRFGEVIAAQDICFTARDGQVTGLLGPNGAGKSTTLRMLYGVLTPDRGQALIDGLPVQHQREAALSRLGVLTHQAGIYPQLTARENIRYFGELQGLQGDDLERAIERVLTQLDLRSFADRRAQGFSQGQRLKVALARALVHRPGTLILDEPTNGLDVLGIRALREVIRELRAQGHCIVFSSHVMQEVVALCDDLIVIGQGRVIARGSPDELRSRVPSGSLEDAFIAALEAP